MNVEFWKHFGIFIKIYHTILLKNFHKRKKIQKSKKFELSIKFWPPVFDDIRWFGIGVNNIM